MAPATTHHQSLPLQQGFDRIGAIVAAISGIAVGCFFAYQLTLLPSGYLSVYINLEVLAVAVLFALVGASLLFYRRTPWLGPGLIIAGLLTFATYAVGCRVLLRFDLIPWYPPAIHLVSGERVVIRLKSGTTGPQVEAFVSSKLSFLPDWSDAMERVPSVGTIESMGLALNIDDTVYSRAEKSPLARRMLADAVSAFMVWMRRDSRVSSVELQSAH
ncbi:MAG: hypothetical protein WB919_23470 [Candidatus Sulfotelmatobacter sp.]